jgi:thiol-disulfide isomerase/thioredoxin
MNSDVLLQLASLRSRLICRDPRPRMHGSANCHLMLLLISAAVWFTGCSEGVTIRSRDGATQLTYRCDDIRPHASTQAERQLVGNEALRLSTEAKREGNTSRILKLADARVASGPRGLETAVVELICEDMGRLPQRDVSPGPSAFPAAGATAPAFEAPLVNSAYLSGREREVVSSDGLRDSVVVLYFWASWCVPCIAHLGALGQLARDYRPRGVAIYGVLSQETAPARALRLLEEHNAKELTSILDENRRMSEAYGTFGVPWMFVLDRSGRLAGRCTGCDYAGWDDASLRARLDSLLGVR